MRPAIALISHHQINKGDTVSQSKCSSSKRRNSFASPRSTNMPKALRIFYNKVTKEQAEPTWLLGYFVVQFVRQPPYLRGMNCIVTAGPTFEPLDDVRRLTNFSTGRLGTELANYLAARGHKVILLIGEMSTYNGERKAQRIEIFSTTVDLHEKLKSFSTKKTDVIFHAAAVSDFSFGRIFEPDDGKLSEIKSKKI